MWWTEVSELRPLLPAILSFMYKDTQIDPKSLLCASLLCFVFCYINFYLLSVWSPPEQAMVEVKDYCPLALQRYSEAETKLGSASWP